LVKMLMRISKNSGFVRADRRDLFRQLEWMDLKATSVAIY
jgi:hypothetical protein